MSEDREDFAQAQPSFANFDPAPAAASVVDRMKELMAAGAVPTPAPAPAEGEAPVTVENPPPFGHVTVKVPKYRVFTDSADPDTRWSFTEFIGYDSQPRPRTEAEAAKNVTEVLDDSRAVYVDRFNQPCEAPKPNLETYQGDDWRQPGSSFLQPRNASKMTPGPVSQESEPQYVYTSRGPRRLRRVMRANGDREWQ